MSEQNSRNNGKLLTITELENAAIEIENNLEFVNKTLINKILKALSSIMIMVQHKEPGIFKEILKWFGLYLQVLLSINPDDKILLKYYEKTVPTVISYIIGCLQYNTKELINYHFNLLEILEEILDNVQTKVLKQIKQFETGTIGCLWNPIDVAGDFNTQLKALKILSILLKQFDETTQNEELKCIKWTNLNLFQDKLKIIVQETKLQHVMENNSRDLLNNYNMNLSKNVLVYSFFCLSVNLAKKYTFYKPLNHEKFWIDINYRPQTLSYKGRFKMYSKSKYEEINVVLKIQMMKLENNNLIIYFKTPGEFSKYTEYFSNVSNNVIQFNLTNEERQRLNSNDYIIKYFNNLNKISIRNLKKYNEEENNTHELLKSEMTTNLKDEITNKTNSKRNSNSYQKCLSFLNDCTSEENVYDEKSSNSSKSLKYNGKEAPLNESPKSSRKNENDIQNRSTRKLRNKRKFFTSLLEENSDDEICKKKTRKRSQNKKSRQNKSRCKQVCKVTPTVDLTKMDNIKTNVESSVNIEEPKNVFTKPSPKFISTQDCVKVMQQVANIYNTNDDVYAKPCQSYRNFKTESAKPLADISNANNISRATRRKNKTDNIKNESTTEKKLKLMDDGENKENINPENQTQTKNIQAKPKRIISPHLFETQRSNETPPRNLEQKTQEKDKNIEIDLTLDEILTKPDSNKHNQKNSNNEHSLSSSSDCEEVRGLNEIALKDIQHICTPTKSVLNCSSNVSTPRAPSIMNVSELSDSDMEITQIPNTNFPLQQQIGEVPRDINLKDNINMELTLVENKENEIITTTQNDLEMMRQQEEIRDIINDFDYSSDEWNCNITTPIKNNNFDSITTPNLNKNLIGHNYQRDCVVFQKRFDSDSSDDDFDITRDSTTNLNIVSKENLSLDLNKTCSTPDIVTTMATKCEVTPNAIIVHQIQVSAKKSVLYRRNHSKVNKCLNNYYKSSSNKLKELHKDAITLGKDNRIKLKEKYSDTNSLALDKYDKTYQKIARHSLDENSKLTKFPTALHHHLKEMEYIKPKKIDTFKSNGGNLFDKPSINGITDELFEDLPENLEYSASNVTNGNFNTRANCDDLENANNTFKSDLLQIFNNYNTNIQQRLNTVHERYFRNMSNSYTRKFCEIAHKILKKSDEERIELEQIRYNIGRLVRELQEQYDEFANKYKQFDIHKEITENVLKIITNMDEPNSLTHDYEELIKEIQNEQQEILDKIWQKYLEKRNH